MSTRRDRARGYILVETLVALLVLALVLGTTLATVGQSVRAARRVSDTRLALLVARSTLASVGSTVALAPGTSAGTDAGFAWRASIDPAGGGLARVSVTVARPGAPPLARLTTLRFMPGLR